MSLYFPDPRIPPSYIGSPQLRSLAIFDRDHLHYINFLFRPSAFAYVLPSHCAVYLRAISSSCRLLLGCDGYRAPNPVVPDTSANATKSGNERDLPFRYHQTLPQRVPTSSPSRRARTSSRRVLRHQTRGTELLPLYLRIGFLSYMDDGRKITVLRPTANRATR